MTTATSGCVAGRYVVRRYGNRQIDDRPADVVADLLDAFRQAIALGYANG
jgi:hypothetical protein